VILQLINEINVYILILTVALGFLGGFIDNAFGMGYGLLTPIFIIIGFSPLVVVPTLLLSQAITGFSGTIFHQLYKNVEFKSINNQETKIVILFVVIGITGSIFATIFAITLNDLFMLLYIGTMMIIVGIIVTFKIRFHFSWRKLYIISVIAGFNKAISGGGYGSLVTSGQLMSGIRARTSVGVTQFSECTISAFGYLLYVILIPLSEIILTFQLSIIMALAGLFAAPFGALLVKKIEDDLARKIVGLLSIILGAISLIRLLFRVI